MKFQWVGLLLDCLRHSHSCLEHSVQGSLGMLACGWVSEQIQGIESLWIYRVASAARSCYNSAIQIAFRGGYFAALINIALAIFGISLLFIVLYVYLYFTLPNKLKVLLVIILVTHSNWEDPIVIDWLWIWSIICSYVRIIGWWYLH